MNIWPKSSTIPYPYPSKDMVIFKRHECEWILPLSAANHFKYNPRHLPVVIEKERQTNEAYYLYLSMRRIIHGYRGSPTSSFICEDVTEHHKGCDQTHGHEHVEQAVCESKLPVLKWNNSI